MGLQRRKPQNAAMAEEGFPLSMEGPLEGFPVLMEWLTALTWSDGASRATGTMMLFVEGGRWKAWLHDRDAMEGCFVSAGTLGLLLASVEDVIASGGGDWRPDKKQGRRGG